MNFLKKDREFKIGKINIYLFFEDLGINFIPCLKIAKGNEFLYDGRLYLDFSFYKFTLLILL